MNQQPIEVYPDKKLVLGRKIGSLTGGVGVGLLFTIILIISLNTEGILYSIPLFIFCCLISAFLWYRTPNVNQPLFIFTEEGLWDYSKKGKNRFLAWKDYTKSQVFRTKGGAYVLLYGKGKMKRIKFSLVDMEKEHLFTDIERYLGA